MSGLVGGILYGSSRDGTWLPAHRSGKYEVDGDLLLPEGFLSEEDQKQYIKYREGTPGFVYIDMKTSNFERSCEHDMNLIERDGKRYLSALPSKKALSEMAHWTQVSDTRVADFDALICPMSPDPNSASAPMLVQGDKTCKFNLHGDLVHCIACCNWPLRAYSWCERKRNWPPGSLVEEITNSVFHLVSKPSTSGDQEIEWRLSFSFAEFKLMDSITGPKLTTYMILKNLLNENDKLRDGEVFKTYHLKTGFFWACEKQASAFWDSEQVQKCVSSVLDSLIEGFDTRFLPHYFIHEINLLEDLPKQALQETTEELRQIKDDLQVKSISQKPEIGAIAVMEMASMKVLHALCKEQLERKETDRSSDMKFVGMSLIRECSPYISDYASIACHSAHNGLISKTQLWQIEETLSCCYAMLHACAAKVFSLVMKCKDEHQRIEELVERLKEFKDQPQMIEALKREYKEKYLIESLQSEWEEQNEDDHSTVNVLQQSETIKNIMEIEYPHGHYDSPYSGELTYFPYGGMVLKLALAISELTIDKKIEFLLNKTVLAEDGWDLDVLINLIKFVLPDFEWSSEGHLTIHQLAQEGVWRFEIPFDTLVKQKNNLNFSRNECQGKCWEERLNKSKEILFGSDATPEITMYEVLLNGRNSIYAEGQKLENTGALLLLKEHKRD